MFDEMKCKAVAKRIFLNDLSECEKFPKYITIETVNGCNASCIMCPRGKERNKVFQYMDDETFDKIIQELKQYKDWIEMIVITGEGEPLLDKKLPDRIRKLKDIGMKYVQFSTNASLLTEEWVHRLYQSGVDDIRCSVDGFHKDTYEMVRVGLDYDVVNKNVLNFLRIRDELKWDIHVRIRMVGLDINKDEQAEWMAYWKGKVWKTDKVQVMPAEPWEEFHKDEREKYVLAMQDVPCVALFSTIVIRTDGSVQLCCLDALCKYYMGNVMDSSIVEIWRSEKFRNYRNLHMEGRRNEIDACRGCITWNNEFKEEV